MAQDSNDRMVDPRSVLVRPMRPEDVVTASEITQAAFREVDRATARRTDPEPTESSPRHRAAWEERTRHFLATDPAGCWVVEVDAEVTGFAVSYRRDLTWILATYAVQPGRQGVGIGTPLLAASLGHSRGCLRGMLAASDDPRAIRRYRLAGFTLHPQLLLTGTVDRSAIPVVEHVREGTAGDFELMDSIDRRLRDAAHGVDHEVLTRLYRLLVTDRSTGSGYAYVDDGRPVLVAATNRRTATRLLWEALASSEPGTEVSVAHVTAANEWALDVGIAARLAVRTSGHLALRGMKPPMPYLHHGSFL
ncbi:GNAT family N-acetyltransferase [Nocardioides terrisoli]|uniref:GNAT family N-acetyltransferase n=1 Tax=Nocardioides terrisoli TaxID=3388267 RepID=UPI00287BB83E|nr:GNAT family N-acetyltransferase [Nocardioides marmorisolisilvae]